MVIQLRGPQPGRIGGYFWNFEIEQWITLQKGGHGDNHKMSAIGVAYPQEMGRFHKMLGDSWGLDAAWPGFSPGSRASGVREEV